MLSAVPVFVFVSAAGNLFSSRQRLDDVAEGEIKGERKSRKVVPHKSEVRPHVGWRISSK